MIDLIVLIPALFAAVAAWDGSRAARALLASLAVAYAADWAGVEFHRLLWAGLDIVVCLHILMGKVTRWDAIIVILFAPAWAAYFTPDPYYHLIPNIVVGLQFLLTIGAVRHAERFRSVVHHHAKSDHFDLKVRA